MDRERFDRQARFFGEEGQERLAACTVAVVGIGGLGTHVVQQLALLGVGHLILVDSEELSVTNRNRYVGAKHSDPIPGTRKVDLGQRIVADVDPRIRVTKVCDSLVSDSAFDAVIGAEWLFGCVDREGVRLILNELCAAHSLSYVDLATEILDEDGGEYGGQVCVSIDAHGCLVCWGLLDVAEAQRDILGPRAERLEEALYGMSPQALGRVGPSVVSINGVVASIAVTEFMVGVTGVRPPVRLSTYFGRTGKVVVRADNPLPDCYYCGAVRGAGEATDVRRYVREGVGRFLR